MVDGYIHARAVRTGLSWQAARSESSLDLGQMMSVVLFLPNSGRCPTIAGPFSIKAPEFPDVFAFEWRGGLVGGVARGTECGGVFWVHAEEAFHEVAVEAVKGVAEVVAVCGEFYDCAAEEVGRCVVLRPEGHESRSDHAPEV